MAIELNGKVALIRGGAWGDLPLPHTENDTRYNIVIRDNKWSEKGALQSKS
jgi:hypothetical protein